MTTSIYLWQMLEGLEIGWKLSLPCCVAVEVCPLNTSSGSKQETFYQEKNIFQPTIPYPHEWLWNVSESRCTWGIRWQRNPHYNLSSLDGRWKRWHFGMVSERELSSEWLNQERDENHESAIIHFAETEATKENSRVTNGWASVGCVTARLIRQSDLEGDWFLPHAHYLRADGLHFWITMAEMEWSSNPQLAGAIC